MSVCCKLQSLECSHAVKINTHTKKGYTMNETTLTLSATDKKYLKAALEKQIKAVGNKTVKGSNLHLVFELKILESLLEKVS